MTLELNLARAHMNRIYPSNLRQPQTAFNLVSDTVRGEQPAGGAKRVPALWS